MAHGKNKTIEVQGTSDEAKARRRRKKNKTRYSFPNIVSTYAVLKIGDGNPATHIMNPNAIFFSLLGIVQ